MKRDFETEKENTKKRKSESNLRVYLLFFILVFFILVAISPVFLLSVQKGGDKVNGDKVGRDNIKAGRDNIAGGNIKINDGIEEQLSSVDSIAYNVNKIIGNSSDTQMIIVLPKNSTLKVNQPSSIKLALSKNLKEDISRSVNADPSIKPERINVPSLLSASLDSEAEDGIIIKKLAGEIQALTSDSSAEWEWSVISKTAGKKNLTMSISAVIPNNAPVNSKRILTRNIELKVEQDFSDWLSQNAMYILTFFSGSLPLPIFSYIKSKLRTNSSNSSNLPTPPTP